jgi:hypothetical protein
VVDDKANRRISDSKAAVDYSTPSRKQTLIDQITSKLQQELHEKYSKIATELDKEFSIEAKLASSSASSKAILMQLQESKKTLGDSIHEIYCLMIKLQSSSSSWQLEHESPVLESLRPFDELSDQVTRIIAEQLTIDDCLYFLNKALTAEVRKSEFSSLVKESRKLARQQFLAKVHLLKIQNATSSLSS